MGNIVPSDYTKIEYIKTPEITTQSAADQAKAFICTNIANSSISKVILKYGVISFVGSQIPMTIASHLIGNTTPEAPYTTVTGYTSGGLSTTPTITSPYDGKMETYTVTYPQGASNYLRIGGWSDSAWTAEGAYYFVKVYNDNDELIASFIPCIRNSDDKVGMFETVSQIFYSSNGSKEFIAGGTVSNGIPLNESRHLMFLNTPHRATVTGTIATFNTDLAAPLTSLKASFLPIQEGSGDPSPNNIRAISGWTGIKVCRAGKNLLDPTTKSGPPLVLNECWFGSDYYNNGQLPVGNLFLPPNNYILSTTGVPTEKRINKYDKTIIAHAYGNSKSLKFTTTEENNRNIAAYISVNNNQSDIWKDETMIELGNSATTFESYSGATISLDWTNDAGEIFGGYVDLVKGELVEEWTAKHVKDWTWYVYSQWSVWYVPLSPTTRSPSSRDISDKLVSFQGYDWNSAPLDSIISGNSNYMFIKHTGATSSTEFNNWIAEVDPIVVYKRATPIIHTLTPLQIKTLLGTNNIWSNANSTVEATYWTH